MELDDVFYIGRRPATLRMVLGLMEDADNSLETYRWATPALLHAIHTNDKLLSQYVEEVFQRKGLTPYVPKKKDDEWNRFKPAFGMRPKGRGWHR